MIRIMLEIKTDNSAFENDKEAEVKKIIAKAALMLQRNVISTSEIGEEGRNILDSNGNVSAHIKVEVTK